MPCMQKTIIVPNTLKTKKYITNFHDFWCVGRCFTNMVSRLVQILDSPYEQRK